MNREILFRGKRVSDGKWVEGQLLYFKASVGKGVLALIVESAEWDNANEWFNLCKRAKVIPETVGQYTGLTDKNGKKIFEGDIVKIAYCFGWDDEQEKDVPEEEYISKVYSIDGCPFCVDLLHCDGDMSPIAWLDWSYDDAEIEVIGNIHDNPELLEVHNG